MMTREAKELGSSGSRNKTMVAEATGGLLGYVVAGSEA